MSRDRSTSWRRLTVLSNLVTSSRQMERINVIFMKEKTEKQQLEKQQQVKAAEHRAVIRVMLLTVIVSSS